MVLSIVDAPVPDEASPYAGGVRDTLIRINSTGVSAAARRRDIPLGIRCGRLYRLPGAIRAPTIPRRLRMPARTPSTDVDAFLRELEHPQDAAIRRLRAVIQAADPRIGEGIKWNAPSFHVDGHHFATMQLRRQDSVLLVLHLGAAKRAMPDGAIHDPDGLLSWMAADRATVPFVGTQDVDTRAAALQAVLRQWMAHV
jgi:hypothetical protein